MNLIERIDQHEYLYLTDIGEPEDNVLRLVIEEARASGEPEDMKIGDVTLAGARSIISDKYCFAYEVVFGNYVAYSVRNESFVVQDESEEFEGRQFCVYTKSRFLDYVRVATFASDDYPGKLNHYGINCLNHIVDVISAKEPHIDILRRARQVIGDDASIEWLS
ncbi:MAG TPA: hypothetical protein VEZ40_04300 [Pyrinomonadaceae bacterium]|nr:hypothetical protein [Pyrinomonadaceae bacterium]